MTRTRLRGIFRNSGVLIFMGEGTRPSKRMESDKHATTVVVDLAKPMFQLTVAGEQWRIFETQRLSRTHIHPLLYASSDFKI